MELTLTWLVMRGRQPFTLLAGQFNVLKSSIKPKKRKKKRSFYMLAIFPNNSFYHLFILGKETSTLYTRWCSMELTYTSLTYRAKLQCIMQWWEETCGWKNNTAQIVEQMPDMWFSDYNIVNTSVLFCSSSPVLQCIICGRQECFSSQTLTCTKWHHFTSQHPQATQRWCGT